MGKIILTAIILVLSAPVSATSIDQWLQKSQNIPLVELYKPTLDQVESLQDHHILISYDRAKVMQQVKALNDKSLPLFGVPLVIKDNILTQIYPTSNGVKALQPYSSRVNAIVAEQLLTNGAVIVGKSNLHEFAGGITSVNSDFGAVTDPSQQGYFVGGSSGGSAVAVKTQMVPVAIGSDTAGSVRIPASLVGVVGFRPTTSRYSTEGMFPLSTTFDAVGIMSNSVKDVQIVDSVLATTPVKKCSKKQFNLAIPKNHYFDSIDSEIRERYIEVMQKVYQDGHQLLEINVPNLAHQFKILSAMTQYEAHEEHPRFIHTYFKGFKLQQLSQSISSEHVRTLVTSFQKDIIKPNHYRQLKRQHYDIKQQFKKIFERYQIDALIYPTTIKTANKLETEHTDGLVKQFTANTLPAAIADMPSISLPLGINSVNLAFGISLDGQTGQDECLLATANWFFESYLQ